VAGLGVVTKNMSSVRLGRHHPLVWPSVSAIVRCACRRRPLPEPLPKIWQLVRDAHTPGRAARKSGFIPSMDCSLNLMIDPRRSDQARLLPSLTSSLPSGEVFKHQHAV
jgi:hypothetical protein